MIFFIFFLFDKNNVLKNETGNWIHVALRDESQQFLILQRNGAFLDDNTMIGVIPCKEETFRTASAGPCLLFFLFFSKKMSKLKNVNFFYSNQQ